MSVSGKVFVETSMKIGLSESRLKGHTKVDTKTCGRGSIVLHPYLQNKRRELKYGQHGPTSPTRAVCQLH